MAETSPDELLQPSVSGPKFRIRPWDPRTHLAVAAVGGSAGATWFALRNAWRYGTLDAEPDGLARHRAWLVRGGAAAAVAETALMCAAALLWGPAVVAGRAVSILLALSQIRSIRLHHRAFRLREGRYAPGTRNAVYGAVGGLLLQTAVVAAAVAVGS